MGGRANDSGLRGGSWKPKTGGCLSYNQAGNEAGMQEEEPLAPGRISRKREETRMKLMKNKCFGAGRWMGHCLIVLGLMGMALGCVANAQAISTTTVQGTVYLANGQAGAGTLDVSWPAFTTANNQAVTAGRITVSIAPDGFMSVSLAPNLGATPAGLYYTAVYHMSDGTTSTEYWVVPAAAQAVLGQVRAQVMPAAQAVQAVSKAYVDQSIAQTTSTMLSTSGGTLSGPLNLSGDPTQALQAADKHYVDATFGKAVPLAGGNMTGALAAPAVNGVQAPATGSGQTTLQGAIAAAGTNGAVEIPPTYTGTDGFSNPNGVYVRDLRQTSSQQFERSVKEFGAVCDGSTDDTNALQAALNYAQGHGVALTIPQGTCKTRTLIWRGESIGGMGKQVSALMGFPGQDVLTTVTDSVNLLSYTRIHDLTIYVDQSLDVSCSKAEGRAPAGSCAVSRLLESNSIFSPGGNGLTGTTGTGAGWAVGNCAIAMPAVTGAGGNGLRVAEIENLEILTTGVDPMAQYTGAHSTHTCGMYLAQWPQWSEFRNIDIRGVNTGIAMPALPGTAPTGLNADSNRWQNITIQATHGFTAAAGSNNVLDDVVVTAGNSAATAEPPTGLVLDLTSSQQGWTVRNAVVLPAWNAVQPQLTVSASGGAITGVTVGPEHGLGFDPYGAQVALKFSGSCTAQAMASVNTDGSLGAISVTQGGAGCSGTTTASVNVSGTWDTAAPVNLIGGQNATLFGGNLLKGNGGYTVWNAVGSQSYGTQLAGGGGSLPGGGTYSAMVANSALGSSLQVDQFPGADFGAKLQTCLSSLSAANGGTCDARNFTGNLSMGSNLTVSTANATVLLPCATISTGNQLIVTAGTRNVVLRGCALRGTSSASGSQGGTVFLYSGTGAMVQVGDPTYAADTPGFHMDNMAINITAGGSTAKGLAAYRTQEMDIESAYFLGDSNQTGMTLDGTGNYTGGTFFDNAFTGFQTAVNAIGHQVSNPATTDWMNASAFVRLHIDCPTSGGSPIAGTYGINLQQGDGNTFTGGDVEGCSTALHLGANAQNNTIVGLRNENSTSQVVADAGSAYNNWMTGGTMFTGQLTDNGTRNSFLDTFHRSFNGVTGDWYGSQNDATVTNHYRLGTGAGNERGLLDRYQTDYGYRWTMGLSDGTAGEQFYQLLDELNNVYRLSIGQYNNGQSSTNNQTVINAAGTGAVVLNGSNHAGTGGVVFGSGGSSESTVATIGSTGNAQFNGTLQVGGASTLAGTPTVKNQADAEIDATLWAGLTASQKESFIYKDWNGNSQWYMVKDASNNWALNSATGGLDSFKAYQSTNSGDTYIDASNSTGIVRVNYESGSGTGFNIYGGNSGALYASFTGTTAIKFPGLAAGSGHNCLQIDNSGYITNTGSGCGGGGGSINSGIGGQIAYYTANGITVGGMNTVPVTAGGTGTSTAAGALANLGGVSVSGATMTGALNLSSDTPSGHQAASANAAVTALSVLAFGAKADVQPPGALWMGISVNLTAGSNIITAGSGTPFAAADIGKYIKFVTWATAPFAITPYVAQITAVTDSSHIVVSKTASATMSLYMRWGTDNVPAFNACIAAAALASAPPCVVPAGDYLMATSPYYIVTGASDDGSYGTPAGGSGAAITAVISGGSISGYTVTSGGSGYTPNSSLQLSISGGCAVASSYGYDGGPCGWAWATANTNSSGQVVSVTPVYAGYGFTSAPTVSVIPLGGDGATATASISGGSINSTTVTAGGGGYAPSSTVDWYGIGGTGCVQIGAQYAGHVPYTANGTATTNSSGAVTSLTVTNAGSGCTSAPAIAFGDFLCNSGTIASPVYGQCNNLAPLNPIALPAQVVLTVGTSWQGEGGALLESVWDGQTVDGNQPALFAGPIAYEAIRNLSLAGAFIGILANQNVNFSNLENLSFTGAMGLLTQSADLGSEFNNLTFYSAASWVNGFGWWTRRDITDIYGGFFDDEYATNIISEPAYNSKVDDWFAANFWHPEFSAASTDFPETCKFPQTPHQRQTMFPLGINVKGNAMCYRGITGIGMVMNTREGLGPGSGTVSNLTVKGAPRNIFTGHLGSLIGSAWSCENCGSLSSDPYRNASTQEGAVIAYESANASVSNVSWGNGTINRCIWSVNTQGDPFETAWSGNNCGSIQNAQTQYNPDYPNLVAFPYGLSVGAPSSGPVPLNFYGTTSLYTTSFEGDWEGYSTGGATLGARFMSPSRADWFDILSTGVKANLPFSAPSVSINGGTAITSESSANSQVVTCASGGTTTQYCGADGNWHTPLSTGPASVVAGTGLNGGGSSGAVTLNCNNATTSTPGCFEPDGTTITCTGSPSVCSASLSGLGVLTTAGGQTVTTANTTIGLPAGCQQYPCVVAKVAPGLFSGLSGFSFIPLYSIPSGGAGVYRSCETLTTTVAGTGGSYNIVVNAYSDGHSANLGGIGPVNATPQWGTANGCQTLYLDASQTVQWEIYGTETGTPTVRYQITFERLQ